MRILLLKVLILFGFTLVGWGGGMFWYFTYLFDPVHPTHHASAVSDLNVPNPMSNFRIENIVNDMLLTDFGQDSHTLLIGTTAGLVVGCIFLMMVELKKSAGRVING